MLLPSKNTSTLEVTLSLNVKKCKINCTPLCNLQNGNKGGEDLGETVWLSRQKSHLPFQITASPQRKISSLLTEERALIKVKLLTNPTANSYQKTTRGTVPTSLKGALHPRPARQQPSCPAGARSLPKGRRAGGCLFSQQNLPCTTSVQTKLAIHHSSRTLDGPLELQ